MAGKKGMKHYPEELKERVRIEYEAGESMHALSRKYGVSRYSVESWCGKRPEVNLRQAAPLKRGRPGGEMTAEDYERKIKRLEMENELLRDFLGLIERK